MFSHNSEPVVGSTDISKSLNQRIYSVRCLIEFWKYNHLLNRRLDDYMASQDLEVELMTVLLIRNLCGSDLPEKADTLNIGQMKATHQSLVKEGSGSTHQSFRVN
jgi:hypothetical protein